MSGTSVSSQLYLDSYAVEPARFNCKDLLLAPWKLTESKVVGFFLTLGLVLITAGAWLIPIAIGVCFYKNSDTTKATWDIAPVHSSTTYINHAALKRLTERTAAKKILRAKGPNAEKLKDVPKFNGVFHIQGQAPALPKVPGTQMWNFGGRLNTKNCSDVIPNIGSVGVVHTWRKKPETSILYSPYHEQQVSLPRHMSLEDYSNYRKEVQRGVLSGNGISIGVAREIAFILGGVTVTGVYKFQIDNLLNGVPTPSPLVKGEKVDMHYVFQSGLNFSGVAGGGMPCKPDLADSLVESYYQNNAHAAIEAAFKNESDVLVYNPFIGTGEFCKEDPRRKTQVKNANKRAIIIAMRQHKQAHPNSKLRVMLPTEKEAIFPEDDFICVKCDKDMAAAVFAKRGYRVSLHVAADPMSMLGVHGPGLWWESCGMASDEERQAYLSMCYKVGYTPIKIYGADGSVEENALLSEFMITP